MFLWLLKMVNFTTQNNGLQQGLNQITNSYKPISLRLRWASSHNVYQRRLKVI